MVGKSRKHKTRTLFLYKVFLLFIFFFLLNLRPTIATVTLYPDLQQNPFQLAHMKQRSTGTCKTSYSHAGPGSVADRMPWSTEDFTTFPISYSERVNYNV